jgi:hypothetical protein
MKHDIQLEKIDVLLAAISYHAIYDETNILNQFIGKARTYIKIMIAERDADNEAPKFAKTYCSQCGGEFGPGDSGYSHCEDHMKGDE